MLLLINRKDLMGKYTNSHWCNAIAWVTAGCGEHSVSDADGAAVPRPRLSYNEVTLVYEWV